MTTDNKTLADALTRFRCAGYDPTDGSGPIMVADPDGPWVLAADVIGTSSDCEATPARSEATESGGDWFGDVLSSIGTAIPLADVQPGGRVRLGDVNIVSGLRNMLIDIEQLGAAPMTVDTNLIRDAIAALSAHPSPGGQGALELLARFLQEPMHDLDMEHEISLSTARDAIAFALAARQPVYEGHTWVSDYVLAGLRERAEMPLQLRNGEVWHWQGDGHDFPESLACPVIMSAEALRALLVARQPVGEQ